MEGGTSARQLVSNDVMGKSLWACINTRAFDDDTKYPSEAEVSRREQLEQEYSSLEQGDTLPLVLSAQDIPVHHQQCSPILDRLKYRTIEGSLAQVSLSPYLTHNTPNCFRKREGMERESSC